MNTTSDLGAHAEFQADVLESARKRFHGITITGICKNCSSSQIYKTQRMNDPIVLCTRNEYALRMPIDLTECNKFTQIGKLDIWDLAKLAKDINVDSKKLGFNAEREEKI